MIVVLSLAPDVRKLVILVVCKMVKFHERSDGNHLHGFDSVNRQQLQSLTQTINETA